MSSARRRELRRRISARLVNQLRIFLLICLIMVVLVIVDMLREHISAILVILGFAVGTLMGVLVSRMNRIVWDDRAENVVSRMDRIGGCILALYIGFMLGRNWIFEHWLQGAALTTFVLSMTAGTMLGRVLGTRKGIRVALETVGLIDKGGS